MYRKQLVCQSFHGTCNMAIRILQAVVYEEILKFPVPVAYVFASWAKA